ncbi:hypothetical protein BDW71DRAFT_190884 [Aspergillus fruticulosus]
MMTSFCKEYYQFLQSQGILGGLSTGLLFTPSVSVLATASCVDAAWQSVSALGAPQLAMSPSPLRSSMPYTAKR